MLDTKALALEMAKSVRKSIDDAVAPMQRQLAVQSATILALQDQVKQLAEREPINGKDGRDGKDGQDGAAGKDGEPGARGDQGPQGEPGERGLAGERGEVGQQGEQGVAGERGADGLAGERGERGEAGERGLQGVAGEAGERGETGAKGERGQLGERGLTGDDGADGRDAIHLEVLPAIDDTKSYPRNTYAAHANGLWRSFETTVGMKGWECLVAGLAEFAVEPVDERGFEYRWRLSNGASQTKRIDPPAMIYREIFTEGREYSRGDVVTWAGSTWHCQDTTKEKPGEGKAWRLVVKRGANGKDGEPGKQGERGRDGKDFGR